VAFFMVDGGVAYLIRFTPPRTTTISFLGRLSGGKYHGVVERDEAGHASVVGFLDHERLKGDDAGPFRIELEPIRGNFGPTGQNYAAAQQRAEELRKLFRSWAIAPPERESV